MNDRGALRVTGNHLESSLAKLDGIVRRIGHAVAGHRPVIGVRVIHNFDVVQHLDPVDSAPAGHNEPQWKSVQQGKLLAVHGESDHHPRRRERDRW